MLPDDPRHGTYAGYVANCRLDCCRTAARNYHKRRVYEGVPRVVPSVGVRRRIQALACLGWSMYDLARMLGVTREAVRQWTLPDEVYRSTHETVAKLYDELSMVLPPQDTLSQRQTVGRVRSRARRNGWFPPLAWDDHTIDDADFTPGRTKTRTPSIRDDIDEIAVIRFLEGDQTVPTTHAERVQIVAEYLRLGRPLADLERAGWRPDRYMPREDGAA